MIVLLLLLALGVVLVPGDVLLHPDDLLVRALGLLGFQEVLGHFKGFGRLVVLDV